MCDGLVPDAVAGIPGRLNGFYEDAMPAAMVMPQYSALTNGSLGHNWRHSLADVVGPRRGSTNGGIGFRNVEAVLYFIRRRLLNRATSVWATCLPGPFVVLTKPTSM